MRENGRLVVVHVALDHCVPTYLARSCLDYAQSKRVWWNCYAPVGTRATAATLNTERPTHETKLSTTADETVSTQNCNEVILLHKVHAIPKAGAIFSVHF
jgi:hypothetical protein